MAKISQIRAREVLDSRGMPTIEAVVWVEGNIYGRAMVPSGASTGHYEASELRDKDEKRFGGKGVLKAVKYITTEIQHALVGKDTADQRAIDETLVTLDGTPNKGRLGANAILAVSLAAARATAKTRCIPLYQYLSELYPNRVQAMPIPHINVINGGKHASNQMSIQEFQIIPVGAARFSEALRMGVEIYHALKHLLLLEGLHTEVGDEAGFAPLIQPTELVFTLLVRAIEKAGYQPGNNVLLGIDAAANEFYDLDLDQYHFDKATLAVQDLAAQYAMWKTRYPLISFEDPFADTAWAAWQEFTRNHGKTTQVVGDDLYATNSERIKEGIERKASNAVIIKPNQVGTLTETLYAIQVAQAGNQEVIISHRSGETEDTFIADLAVAVGASQIKTGAPARGERTAKYNRLLDIEEELDLPLGNGLRSLTQHFETWYRETNV